MARDGTGSGDGTLLIYAPVPLYEKDGVLHLEDQASNGLRLWAENFSKVLVMYPLAPGAPPPTWVPVEAAVGDNMPGSRFTRYPPPIARTSSSVLLDRCVGASGN